VRAPSVTHSAVKFYGLPAQLGKLGAGALEIAGLAYGSAIEGGDLVRADDNAAGVQGGDRPRFCLRQAQGELPGRFRQPRRFVHARRDRGKR
jgi:hypothetical protein